ncbi:MAG: ATP-binding cassette domain-containing protein [Candidatus Hatepunaea meridiana]|nr:ATP-binding cassette domain-containing protein [Candidatus Hatepunaea meridiana]
MSEIKAVDGINLAIYPGEIVGLVGESGCGKTTLGRTILRIVGPTSGAIIFDGQDISELSSKELGPIRPDIQMVFQDPFSSLNPRMRVKDLVAEPLRIQDRAQGAALEEEVHRLVDVVGLDKQMLWRLPRDLSGGQRQRVAVARALALRPKLLVLDEPTSALDVSVQTQVLNLFVDLQDEFGLTYLIISHDLGVIRYICDRIAIMYMGRIVETGSTSQIFNNPLHPYTQALLSIMAEPGVVKTDEIILAGEVSRKAEENTGCRFANRCFAAKIAKCEEIEPALIGSEDKHLVACYLYHGQSILGE